MTTPILKECKKIYTIAAKLKEHMDSEQPFILVRALPKANESQEFQN